MAKMVENLIITADDFGACNFIDRGILKGINEGLVTCVSAFVNFKERKRGENGGAYVGSIKAIEALMAKDPAFPIGLHLTINAGSPVANISDVNQLVQDMTDPNTKLKTIDEFELKTFTTPWIKKQIAKEVEAQLELFRKVVGKDPNHISCHFCVLFTFKDILEEILINTGISGIPVRNHSLIFQTPYSLRDSVENERKINRAKRFFSKTSQMRKIGLSRGIDWALYSFDGAISVFESLTDLNKRMKLLMKHKCYFPDYTIDSLYRKELKIPKKRGGGFKKVKNIEWKGKLEDYLEQVPDVIPHYYSKYRKRNEVVAELICHLGTGSYPKTKPNGIDISYFDGREVELQRLIAAKPGFISNAVNLVDFDFLEESGFA